MSDISSDQLLQMETTCGSLLYELQIIWDEVGESDADRDKMLLELEQECLEVYKRKVDQANRSRAELRQEIADHEAELAAICSALCEWPLHIRQSDQNMGSLKEELKAITPQLEEMRRRKNERLSQFVDTLEHIQKVSKEVMEPDEYNVANFVVDESNLSTRKLDELRRHLQALQEEKGERLRQVLGHLNTLNSLCVVLGVDFKPIICEVHPSLNDSDGLKSISNSTIERLGTATQRLREVKIQRMQKLQDLATSMLELWNLMDIPLEEQQIFQHITCKIAANEHELTEQGILSQETLNNVETEVARLEVLKSSKMKELVLKKKSELEDLCRRAHMLVEADTPIQYVDDAVDSGTIDPVVILEQIELEIAKVKEEAFSRREIIEKVDKWLAACEEESWLEEYNRDENRYNAGRGAHLTLKRAEKARATVAKLPNMVEALVSKTLAWTKERGVDFTYDGVRLLSMLEEYRILRQEKEEERLRKREEKRLQEQLIAEQEARFGSKPSPLKTPNVKKTCNLSGNTDRRFSAGNPVMQTSKINAHSVKFGHGVRSVRKRGFQQDDGLLASFAGRRGLDTGSPWLKKLSAHTEGLPARKPFSPVPIISSKANMPHSWDAPFVTPTKVVQISDEENKTPNDAANSALKTPSIMPVPMQMAITPVPPATVLFETAQVEKPEEVEYSFEEKRLGYVVSSTQMRHGDI